MTTVLLSSAQRSTSSTFANAIDRLGGEHGPFVLIARAAPTGAPPEDLTVLVVTDPVAGSHSLRARALRRLARCRPTRRVASIIRGGTARSYFRAVRADPRARAELRSASVVVALDSATLRTAWRASRSNPGGPVVNGISALRRLEEAEGYRDAP